jgi:hypothetical protein
LRLPIAAAAAGLFAVATGVSAAAGCGNLEAATLSGQWQLRITVLPPSGTVPSGFARAGTTAVQTVSLSTVCSATGQCTATLATAGGGLLPLYQNSTGWYWLPSTGLSHAGATYSGTSPRGGFGGEGLPPCPPPAAWGTQSLTLTVAQAVPDAAGGWRASLISGTETSPVGWVCSGGVGETTGVTRLGLLAVPAGESLPASAIPACAAPPATIAAVNPEVSSFSSTLATPDQAFGSPAHTLIGAALTLGVILFITFPAALFNRTFEENYDEIRALTLRRLGWLRRFRRRAEREAGGPLRLAAFAAVVLVGAALGSLNDRGFGLNLRSAATYLAVVLSILVGVGVGGVVGAAYRRLRHHPVEVHLHALPAGLAVAATCVLISRLSAFEPGYLYGVIASLAFQGSLAKPEQGHTVALSSIASLGVAVVAWIAWLPAGHAAAQPGAPFGVVLLADLLGSVFVGGLVGQVISLLPLRFLPGQTLLEWSRAAWAATFGIAVFGLIEVELRPQSTAAHPGGAPLVTAVFLFVLFGGSTLGLRRYFARRERQRREGEERSPGAAAAGPAPATAASSAPQLARPSTAAPAAPPVVAKRPPAPQRLTKMTEKESR